MYKKDLALKALLFIFSTFFLSVSSSANAINSGDQVGGVLEVVEDVDTYSFTASAGDSIQISVSGDIGVQAKLYAPDATFVSSSTSVLVQNSLTQNGTYSIEISAVSATQTGNYDLHFVRIPSANEHGALISGTSVTETLTAGDLDSFTFDAVAGESVQLSIAGDVSAYLYVYLPDGTYYNYATSVLDLRPLPATGTYTVVVRSVGAFNTGSYELHYVRIPSANEHGALTSGDSVTETLTVGDLDSFTFDAIAGESVQLSVAGNVSAYIYVYLPDGTYYNYATSVLDLRPLPATGTYTVVVRTVGAFSTGSYELHYVRIPSANEHGALTSGDSVTETLTAGDLDSFTFDAVAGESVQLSVAGDVSTYVYVYSPDGTYYNAATSVLDLRPLPATGTYTVVVRTVGAFNTGSYELHYVRIPSANEHGGLTNSGTVAEFLTAGDLDSYTFVAASGESGSLSISGSISTYLYIYNPDGTYKTSTTSSVNLNFTSTGTYTVVVRSVGAFQDGDYDINYELPDQPEPVTTQEQVPLPLWILVACAFGILVIARKYGIAK